MKMTGVSGRLAAGGRVAATITGYELNANSTGWQVTATCSDVDDYLAEHAELCLILDVGQREWLWRNVTPEWQGNQITASGAGAPEKR